MVTLLSSVGLLLSIGTHVLWVATGRMMLAIGAVSSVCAYCAGLAANAGWSPFLCYGISAGVGVGLGLLVTILAYRLSIDQFFLLALALSELVRRLAYSLEHVAGGAYGLRVSTMWGLRSDLFSYLVGLSLLVTAAALHVLARTPLGLRWRILGSAKEAGILLGLNPNRTALMAGAVLGFATGLAGALYMDGLRYIHPDDLGASVSLPALAVGISARPRALALDLPLLTFALFTLRELLRLSDLGGAARFAAHDVLVGVFLILGALRLSKTAL